MHLSMEDYLVGDWAEADALTEEALALCGDAGYRFFRWYFQYTQIMLTGARGTGHELAEEITRWAEPRGVGAAVIFAHQARALVCLGEEDYERAFHYATRVIAAGELASHVPHLLWGLLDLVEAAIRTRRHEAAAAHVLAMREADIEDDTEALACFADALAVPCVAKWPFDLARVRLAHGERLRRARAATDARIPLAAALATFEALGAKPWVERARKELRATGLAAPGSGNTVLTPQELAIARLVASGLTNKQVAERMFLSHRTVAAHLGQISGNSASPRGPRSATPSPNSTAGAPRARGPPTGQCRQGGVIANCDMCFLLRRGDDIYSAPIGSCSATAGRPWKTALADMT